MSQDIQTMSQAAVIAEKIPPRARILAAATELFYWHGIRAVGVEAIAEAAETNKMTLYRHFASKDELVAEYLRTLFCEKDVMWRKIEGEHPDDPHAQLMGWLQLVAANVADPKSRGCAIANAAVELPEKDHPARKVIEDCKRKSRESLVALCRKANIAEPELLADQLFMLLEGAFVSRQSVGDHGPACQFVRAGQALINAAGR
jgi:AcrR family transcriptional regulator